MIKAKFLILGAGVSGLTFANHIGDDDYCIIEKESKAGGYCRTTRTSEFVWDYAGHFFHFSNPKLKEKFKHVMKSDNIVYRKKNTKIFYNGYYVDYPFQKNIHQLEKEEFIECLYDLFNKTEKMQYCNFLDMLYGKFGKSITEKFLRPYNEKLYACELNSLDVEAMGRFFPYADIKDIISNMKETNNSSYNEEFLYPKNGAAVFIDILLKDLNKSKIHYDEDVINISLKNHRVKTNKNEYEYEYLISSIPLNSFIKIIDLKSKIDHSIFSYNQVLVFNLGFDKPAVDKEMHWIYVPNKNINFYRAGFYSNIIGSKNLSMYIEIGYNKNAKITQEEINYQLETTLKNLKKMGIIKEHLLVESQSIVMNPAYVHITQNSIRETEKLRSILSDNNVYTLGRYGDWKYCSIEDCMVDALNLINKLKK